ncbi:MAG: tetratricopeptide repeat protein [Reyranellaceae bacterium]
MTIKDLYGHGLTGASDVARDHFEAALDLLRVYRNDPMAEAEAAIADSPGFAMAHALRAWLFLLGTEPGGLEPARASYESAAPLAGTARERGHVAAIGQLLEGRWWAASQALAQVAVEHPHDVLALQVGHQLDFFTGNARMLRDRIARALPEWAPGMPGYHALLGMHAFGLEECGDYARAERQGKRAVELDARDSWAQHAVAHVLEMQGRQADGIAWMRAAPDNWTRDSFFAVHNWWHLALYHLDLGEVEEVLKLYDGPIMGGQSSVALELIDHSSMLWRLMLRGVDVGDRWQAVAERWTAFASAGNYAFNDVHAMMAFVVTGRTAEMVAVLEAQDKAMARGDDNAMFTRDVGRPVSLALKAFGDGDYKRAACLLKPVIGIAGRFGGSHAQRDLLDLTLIEAAQRGGDLALARALTAERREVKPTSPFNRTLFDRARAVAQAA